MADRPSIHPTAKAEVQKFIELETGLDTLWTTATSKDTFIDNVVSLGSNISETNVVALLSRHLKDTNQTTLSAIEYSSRRFHQHISTFYANLYVEDSDVDVSDRDVHDDPDQALHEIIRALKRNLQPGRYEYITGRRSPKKRRKLTAHDAIAILPPQKAKFIYCGLQVVCSFEFDVNPKCKYIELAELNYISGTSLLEMIVLDELVQKVQDSKIKGKEAKQGIVPGIFKRVPEKEFFLYQYQHPWGWTSSSAKYELFENVFEPEVIDREIGPCAHTSHPFLCPFFSGNIIVHQALREWIKNNSNCELLPHVNKVLELYGQVADTDHEYELNEEEWNTRLCKSLKTHPSYVAIQTCHGIQAARFEQIKYPMGLPRGFGSMYPFKGGSDLSLFLQDTVLTLVDNPDNPATVPTTVAGAMPETPVAKPDYFVGEHDKSAQPTTFPYPKMGELCANMIIAHTDLVINRNYELRNQTVNGLFIHKSSGASLFQIKLDIERNGHAVIGRYSLLRYRSSVQVLTEALLCNALKTSTGLDMHVSSEVKVLPATSESLPVQQLQ